MITLFGKELPEPRYKEDDEVYVYVNPVNLVDPTQIPVLDCTVDSIKYVANSYYGDPEVRIEYELTTGIDTTWKKEVEIFSTREDALQAAMADLDEMERKAIKKASELSRLVKDVREAMQANRGSGDIAKGESS